MPADTEPTPVGPTAPKRPVGRPRKPNPEIDALNAEIAALKEALAQSSTGRYVLNEPTLAPIPLASEEIRPGTYIMVGKDGDTPIMGKVRWNREWIARTYPAVTFTPSRSMHVSPHGVGYDLGAEIEVTVPQIVKDIYDDVRKQELDHNIRYRTLSASEDAELAVRANEQPGTKQWSRLYRAGYGLQVRPPENTPVEAPVAAA